MQEVDAVLESMTLGLFSIASWKNFTMPKIEKSHDLPCAATWCSCQVSNRLIWVPKPKISPARCGNTVSLGGRQIP